MEDGSIVSIHRGKGKDNACKEVHKYQKFLNTLLGGVKKIDSIKVLVLERAYTSPRAFISFAPICRSF